MHRHFLSYLPNLLVLAYLLDLCIVQSCSREAKLPVPSIAWKITETFKSSWAPWHDWKQTESELLTLRRVVAV